jgi:hypothetical protein
MMIKQKIYYFFISAIPPDAMQIDEGIDIDESDPDKRLPS